MLDVIAWFKIHIKSKPKTENWTRTIEREKSQADIIKGIVINLSVNKGFAFLQPNDGSDNVFIPPHLVTENNLKENDIITGEVEEYIDNRTQELKKRVKNL
ncbi:hypothetical protein A9996_18905 [Gelidibacter algens]|nr:hypothetical protein A9996_18905 [Gelidibacter algens]